MKSVLIWGVGPFSRLMYKYLPTFTSDTVAGFVCHSRYRTIDELEGKAVYALETLETEFSPQEVLVLPSMGYRAMNSVRAKVVEDVRRKGFGFCSFVHPESRIYADRIGEGNIILENVTVGLSAKIGSFNVIFNDCSVSHDCVVGDYNHFSVAVALSGCVEVSNFCFLGTNSTVKNGVRLAERTLLGAGAYLSADSLPGRVYVPERTVCLENHVSTDFF